jgi:beta-lactamase superfamily II metal-dependent hydrolase
MWKAELDTLRRQKSNTPNEATRGSRFPDLDALAAEECTQNRSPTNGSSLAILLEHRGASVLLAGDAFALDLGRGLIDLATARSQSLPIHVDALKLSHHGSRASLVAKLFRTVVASHYVVSTNNRYGHPHDEALAKVVRYGGVSPTLWFNYTTDQNLRWAATSLNRKYQFATRFPEGDAPGITLPLPARVSYDHSTSARA